MAYPSDKKKYFYLVLTFGALILFHYVGWLLPIEKFIRSIALPTMSSIDTISIDVGDHYQIFKNKSEFISAYQSCLITTAGQASQTAETALLKTENNELRKLVSFHKKNPTPLVTVQVVGKELLTTDQTVIINEGSNLGIAVGQPVVTGDGILVGKILKVEPDMATVRLINDNH